MGDDKPTWIGQLLDYAKSQPFPGGFLIGAVFSAVISFYMAKSIAFKGHDSIVKQWEGLNRALKKEIQELKKQMQEKDARLQECHNDIHALRKKLDVPAHG